MLRVIHLVYWSWYYQFNYLDKLIGCIAQGENPILSIDTRCVFYNFPHFPCYLLLVTGFIWDVLFIYAFIFLARKNRNQ